MSRKIARITLSLPKARRLALMYPGSAVVVLSAELLGQEGVTGPHKDRLDREYLDFVAAQVETHGGKFWWANSLSEKNEMLSPLFRHLSVLYAFRRWLDKHPDEDCIVVCDSGLLGTVRLLLEKEYAVQGDRPGLGKFVRTLRNVCRYTVKLILVLWEELYRMVLSRRSFEKGTFRSLRQIRVFKSWVDHRSYGCGEYRDAYFPKVFSYFQERKVPYLILADIIQDFPKHLRSIIADRKNLIVPINYFLTVGDLCRAAVLQWTQRPRAGRRLTFSSIDVTELVRDELEEGFYSTRFFNNILYYVKIKRLARTVDMHSFTYTFENYAWEKMCLTALKEVAPAVRSTGFQHAFIAKNSFKYFLGAREVGVVPTPDRILTMGEVTQRILKSYGGWPAQILARGCALRQFGTMNGIDSSPGNSGRSGNIVVAFTMTRDESVKILEFLFKAGLDRHTHDVYLRFHPQTPVKEVLNTISFELPANFKISDAPSLSDDLKRAGVVLYTWTTVGLEALLNGVPVIYLDVNRPFDLDPLFECDSLKERVGSPERLSERISSFLNLPDDTYYAGLRKARAYLKEYFSPVNDEALARFAE